MQKLKSFGFHVGPLLFGFAAMLSACGNEPPAVLLGHVGTGAMRQALVPVHDDSDKGDDPGHPAGEVEVSINGDWTAVRLDADGSFAAQDIGTGDLEFQVEIAGITGTLDIRDVLPGEVIEVRVTAAKGLLEIRVVRRDAPSHDSEIIEDGHEGSIEIHGNHVVRHLAHGTIAGDLVITGDHVTVVGPDYNGCRIGGRTVIAGDLIVEGDHIRLVNLEVEGRTIIDGDHVRIYDPCRVWKRSKRGRK